MSRPIRIGLIAEGEAELGASVPYVKPEEGGKLIARDKEGALHTLIRRELLEAGLPDCEFVQRHPSIREQNKVKVRTGHSILEQKYLAQVVIAWKPTEVDLILLVVDADDSLTQRQRDLGSALDTIRNNHLDGDGSEIADRSAGGLAIQTFDTWLLADTQTVAKVLAVQLDNLENLEERNDTKTILESAIADSTYLPEETSNQRPLIIRWKLAFEINLTVLKTLCPKGYAAFSQHLHTVAQQVAGALLSSA